MKDIFRISILNKISHIFICNIGFYNFLNFVIPLLAHSVLMLQCRHYTWIIVKLYLIVDTTWI